MLHLITNPLKKKGQKLLGVIEQRLNERGTPYTVHVTQSKGGGREIARELTEAGETELIVIGGDGSLNDVLTGIADPSRCVLGLIPAGTGNDFAAAAKIPYGEKALDFILNGKPEYVDYIDFSDGRRSLNIAGIGIDVDILERCERMKRLRGVKSKYFFSLIASLCKYRGFRISVTVNGETTEHNALIAAVCNGRQLGGGIPLCPSADIADGKLELVVADNPKKRRQLIGALFKLMQGKLFSLSFTHHVFCERAVIKPIRPCCAQYDGELYQTEALDATLVHGQLKMFYHGQSV